MIATALKKYEALKPAYNKLSVANKELIITNTNLSHKGAALDSALASSQNAYRKTDVLYKDSQVQTSQWKAKARKRNLKFFGTIGLLLLTVLVAAR